jgi:protein-serine/threonine kinase
LCAVKIIEVDRTDYKADIQSKDDSIKEFVRETNILRQLTKHNVQNVNVLYDAFAVDTQLWIVTQYCPGGSLATLMKADNRPIKPGLEEQYIVAIAREVAVALKSIHAVGIIHRDIKCANILVTEDGRIQICDFGISNELENQMSKRSTIIGTPHWMAPELVSHLGSEFQSIRYGTEIDCWAYGCAIYEMATGVPPNSRVAAGDLGVTLHAQAPRLEGDRYSPELKTFVAFLLEERADLRPSASQILDNQYIKDTEQLFPTDIIRDLIEYFAKWESEGGQRVSLFNPYGAGAQGTMLGAPSDDIGDWNFSTTLEFDRRMSMGLDPFSRGDNRKSELSAFDKMLEEHRVMRGGDAMRGLFDMDEKPYGSADSSMSDLPLRRLENGGTAADRTTLIDIDAVIPSFELEGPTVALDSVETIRARRFLQNLGGNEDDQYSSIRDSERRDTKDWKFPFQPQDDNPNRRTQDWTFPSMTTDLDANAQTTRRVSNAPQAKNRDTRDWKFPTVEEFAKVDRRPSQRPRPPVGPGGFTKPPLVHAKTMPVNIEYTITESSLASSPDRTSMIDLDAALSASIPEIPRPMTADSTAESAMTDMTSGDPFYLEPQIELSQASNRGSFHMKSQSEPTAGFGQATGLMPQPGDEDGETGSERTSSAAHNRSSSMNRSSLERENSVNGRTGASWYMNNDPRWSKSSGFIATDQRGVGSGYGGSAAGYTSTNGSFDPFTNGGSTGTAEDRLAWEKRFGNVGEMNTRQQRGLKSSTGSARLEDMGTLRPPRHIGGSLSQGMVGPGMGGLRVPREANKGALLPGADRRLAEEELSLLYEELGAQAEVMMGFLSGLHVEDDMMSDGGSVKDAGVGFSFEPPQ